MSDQGLTAIGDSGHAIGHAMVTANAANVLGAMSSGDFARRLEELKLGAERIRMVQAAIMKEDEDYGTIQGTNKPTLYKAGAEKLLQVFGLVADPVPDIRYGDGITEPAITVTVSTLIRVGDMNGPVVGKGLGGCSTFEKKYRYRAGERACPSCGALKTLIKKKDFEDSRRQFTPGWLCFAKKGGCGDEFDLNDPTVVSQKLGEIDNPDPFELLNTVIKMSAKRSIVDGALRATATSGLFTQDLEDDPHAGERSGTERQQAPPPAGAPQGAPASQKAAPRPAAAQAAKPAAQAASSTKAEPAKAEAPAPAPKPAPKASAAGEPLDEMTVDALKAEIMSRAVELGDSHGGASVAEMIARFSFRDDASEGRRTIADVNAASIPWLRYTLNNLRLGQIPKGGK